MTLKIAWAGALAFATSMQAASAQDVERFYAGRKGMTPALRPDGQLLRGK